jgi:RES domain-containing protein
VRHVARGGPYVRVADPDWPDPLSPEHARRRGGRWNPPGSFGVVHLNDSVELARAQVRHRLEPRGIRPEDLDPEVGPLLVHTRVPDADYVDAVTDEGLQVLGLPATYPVDERGIAVPHARCQSIGQAAWDAAEPGIACRSAAASAPPGAEELAFFARRRLRVARSERFVAWYW